MFLLFLTNKYRGMEAVFSLCDDTSNSLLPAFNRPRFDLAVCLVLTLTHTHILGTLYLGYLPHLPTYSQLPGFSVFDVRPQVCIRYLPLFYIISCIPISNY